MTNQDISISLEELGRRRTYEVFAEMPGEPRLSLSLRLRLEEGAQPRFAAAFSSMVLPCLRPATLAMLAETLERAIASAVTLLPAEEDRRRAQSTFRDLFQSEVGRISSQWTGVSETEVAPSLMRPLDRNGKARGAAVSGLFAPRTSLGPKGKIGFWRRENGEWTAGYVEAVAGAVDLSVLRHGANSHDLISMLSPGGMDHPLLQAAVIKMLGGRVPRPMAVFKPGVVACRASGKVYNEAGLYGYHNAPGNRLQHLSIGYNGTGPALSIFTSEDRIRVCDVQNRPWSFASKAAFEQSIEAWLDLLSALDIQPVALKEPKKSVLKDSHVRLEKIEANIGPLPYEDQSFVLGLLGRVYNANLKSIAG